MKNNQNRSCRRFPVITFDAEPPEFETKFPSVMTNFNSVKTWLKTVVESYGPKEGNNVITKSSKSIQNNRSSSELANKFIRNRVTKKCSRGRTFSHEDLKRMFIDNNYCLEKVVDPDQRRSKKRSFKTKVRDAEECNSKWARDIKVLYTCEPGRLSRIACGNTPDSNRSDFVRSSNIAVKSSDEITIVIDDPKHRDTKFWTPRLNRNGRSTCDFDYRSIYCGTGSSCRCYLKRSSLVNRSCQCSNTKKMVDQTCSAVALRRPRQRIVNTQTYNTNIRKLKDKCICTSRSIMVPSQRMVSPQTDHLNIQNLNNLCPRASCFVPKQDNSDLQTGHVQKLRDMCTCKSESPIIPIRGVASPQTIQNHKNKCTCTSRIQKQVKSVNVKINKSPENNSKCYNIFLIMANVAEFLLYSVATILCFPCLVLVSIYWFICSLTSQLDNCKKVRTYFKKLRRRNLNKQKYQTVMRHPFKKTGNGSGDADALILFESCSSCRKSQVCCKPFRCSCTHEPPPASHSRHCANVALPTNVCAKRTDAVTEPIFPLDSCSACQNRVSTSAKVGLRLSVAAKKYDRAIEPICPIDSSLHAQTSELTLTISKTRINQQIPDRKRKYMLYFTNVRGWLVKPVRSLYLNSLGSKRELVTQNQGPQPERTRGRTDLSSVSTGRGDYVCVHDYNCSISKRDLETVNQEDKPVFTDHSTMTKIRDDYRKQDTSCQGCTYSVNKRDMITGVECGEPVSTEQSNVYGSRDKYNKRCRGTYDCNYDQDSKKRSPQTNPWHPYNNGHKKVDKVADPTQLTNPFHENIFAYPCLRTESDKVKTKKKSDSAFKDSHLFRCFGCERSGRSVWNCIKNTLRLVFEHCDEPEADCKWMDTLHTVKHGFLFEWCRCCKKCCSCLLIVFTGVVWCPLMILVMIIKDLLSIIF